MPLFNNLCQFCLAYYKKLAEIQNALSDYLWTMTQRSKSLTALIKVSGNDLATKFFQRPMVELIGAAHLIAFYVLYHFLLTYTGLLD